MRKEGRLTATFLFLFFFFSVAKSASASFFWLDGGGLDYVHCGSGCSAAPTASGGTPLRRTAPSLLGCHPQTRRGGPQHHPPEESEDGWGGRGCSSFAFSLCPQGATHGVPHNSFRQSFCLHSHLLLVRLRLTPSSEERQQKETRRGRSGGQGTQSAGRPASRADCPHLLVHHQTKAPVPPAFRQQVCPPPPPRSTLKHAFSHSQVHELASSNAVWALPFREHVSTDTLAILQEANLVGHFDAFGVVLHFHTHAHIATHTYTPLPLTGEGQQPLLRPVAAVGLPQQ
jgi:hypothetical protein